MMQKKSCEESENVGDELKRKHDAVDDDDDGAAAAAACYEENVLPLKKRAARLFDFNKMSTDDDQSTESSAGANNSDDDRREEVRSEVASTTTTYNTAGSMSLPAMRNSGEEEDDDDDEIIRKDDFVEEHEGGGSAGLGKSSTPPPLLPGVESLLQQQQQGDDDDDDDSNEVGVMASDDDHEKQPVGDADDANYDGDIKESDKMQEEIHDNNEGGGESDEGGHDHSSIKYALDILDDGKIVSDVVDNGKQDQEADTTVEFKVYKRRGRSDQTESHEEEEEVAAVIDVGGYENIRRSEPEKEMEIDEDQKAMDDVVSTMVQDEGCGKDAIQVDEADFVTKHKGSNTVLPADHATIECKNEGNSDINAADVVDNGKQDHEADTKVEFKVYKRRGRSETESHEEEQEVAAVVDVGGYESSIRKSESGDEMEIDEDKKAVDDVVHNPPDGAADCKDAKQVHEADFATKNEGNSHTNSNLCDDTGPSVTTDQMDMDYHRPRPTRTPKKPNWMKDYIRY